MRVLVFTPLGKDGMLTCQILAGAGLNSTACKDVEALDAELTRGVGAVILAEECLPDSAGVLHKALANQPPWSDLPLILLTRRGGNAALMAHAMETLGNVTLVERPVRIISLISAVRAALRARSRQYQIRGYLEGLAQAEEERRKVEIERALIKQAAVERQRIGRELHDGLRQQLVGVRMLATTLHRRLERQGNPEAKMLAEFSEVIAEANVQVRRLIHGLVPTEVTVQNLRSVIQRVAHDIETWYRISCVVEAGALPDLGDDEVANHLYFIAREAMSNAARHGQASHITVRVQQEAEQLVLCIEDDGIGFAPGDVTSDGIGLENMRYRTARIGGHLDISRRASTGMMVQVTVPLQTHAHEGLSESGQAGALT
jgi:signal transduction histidine kinase